MAMSLESAPRRLPNILNPVPNLKSPTQNLQAPLLKNGPGALVPGAAHLNEISSSDR
jgi:hypothetical protein